MVRGSRLPWRTRTDVERRMGYGFDTVNDSNKIVIEVARDCHWLAGNQVAHG